MNSECRFLSGHILTLEATLEKRTASLNQEPCEQVGKSLFEMLFVDDIHLITKVRKNMKNSLMNLQDKLRLRKRAVIETVNDELKNVCQIEHTRHRSIDNFATNLFAGLIAYNLLPKKPEMNIEIIDKSRLIA